MHPVSVWLAAVLLLLVSQSVCAFVNIARYICVSYRLWSSVERFALFRTVLLSVLASRHQLTLLWTVI